MMAKLAAQKKQQEQLAKVAFIDLNKPVSEKPAGFSFFGEETLTLQSILGRLRQARTQADVRGVLINLGSTSFNLAQAQEIRDALVELRKAKKKTFVYADSFDTASYVAATGAENICMLEGGEIMIPGVGLETMFAKGLLDKVGVKADYIQIGQYKGADEQYTRTEPSEQMRGELNKILDSMWNQIVDGISYHRTLPRQDVEDMINDVVVSGKVAKERRFVDHLIDQDGLRELLKKEFARDINLVHNYGVPRREPVDFSNPFALFSTLAKKPEDTDKPKIAVVYAEGVIVDGSGGESLFGGSAIGSEDIRQALRMAVRDEDVEAIVIRIDSPGGSASASEVMWQAARRAAEKKPLVISIGSMAASGGYYLASAGEHVFADPSAIVGSIGVVGGKFVMKDLYDKLGLRTETFTRGRNADLFSSNQPFTASQRRLVTNWMKQTYEQFTDRVLATRKEKIKDIDQVAHGRIFLAKEAKTLGMVDELGGIDSAVAHAAEKAELKAGEYEIRVFPPTRTIADFLMGGEQDAAAMPVRPQFNVDFAMTLRTLSPSGAKMLSQQLQVIELFQKRPVVLVAPFVVNVK
jgi:protease-4